MLYSVHVDIEGLIEPAGSKTFSTIHEADQEARRLYQIYYNEAAEPTVVKGAYLNSHDKTDTAPTFIVWNHTENRVVSQYEFDVLDKGPFYHGTKADVQVGDLLTAGFRSNYRPEILMNHIYFTALVNGAGLAAALARGDGRERVYLVEPTGSFEHDPNVTDKKFPGNPTRSYRSQTPLKVVGEVTDWVKQTPEELQKWRERLAIINADPDATIIN